MFLGDLERVRVGGDGGGGRQRARAQRGRAQRVEARHQRVVALVVVPHHQVRHVVLQRC